MAEALVESLSDEAFNPGMYRDVHRHALTALIDAKATGRTLAQETQNGAGAVDLLTALRASVDAAKQRKAEGTAKTARKPTTRGGTGTTQMTKKPAPRRRRDGPPGKRV